MGGWPQGPRAQLSTPTYLPCPIYTPGIYMTCLILGDILHVYILYHVAPPRTSLKPGHPRPPRRHPPRDPPKNIQRHQEHPKDTQWTPRGHPGATQWVPRGSPRGTWDTEEASNKKNRTVIPFVKQELCPYPPSKIGNSIFSQNNGNHNSIG